MQSKHYETVKAAVAGKAQLMIVTKRHSVEEIMEYYDLGERMFGENRVQDLVKKAEVMPEDIEWQFIGHLQKNKVKQAVPVISRLLSLDSIALAKELEKECVKENRNLPCLFEVHLATEDEHKTGLLKEEVPAFLKEMSSYPHLSIEGMMCMGPHTEDEERVRAVFTEAHDLFVSLQKDYPSLTVLSMGMSEDYPIALECGSNLVRIGSMLFE